MLTHSGDDILLTQDYQDILLTHAEGDAEGFLDTLTEGREEIETILTIPGRVEPRPRPVKINILSPKEVNTEVNIPTISEDKGTLCLHL